MDQLSELLKDRREAEGLNKSQMAEKLGVSSQLYGQYELGTRIPKAGFFSKWREIFNEDLFQKLETNVSRETDNPTAKDRSIRRPKTISTPFMVPFIPVKAQAGYVKAIDQEVYLDTLEKYALPPGVSGHGAIWRYWEVEGDSMEPTFKGGDIVLTSFVHPMDWENIRNFYTYVIVTQERILIKRIYCKNAIEWVLISDNEETYKQQLLPVELIKEVWVYRKTWSTRAAPPKEFKITV